MRRRGRAGRLRRLTWTADGRPPGARERRNPARPAPAWGKGLTKCEMGARIKRIPFPKSRGSAQIRSRLAVKSWVALRFRWTSPRNPEMGARIRETPTTKPRAAFKFRCGPTRKSEMDALVRVALTTKSWGALKFCRTSPRNPKWGPGFGQRPPRNRGERPGSVEPHPRNAKSCLGILGHHL